MPSNYVSEEKKDTVPRCCPRFQKCVFVKSPLMTRVDQHLVNSITTRGQHFVKCVLNPRIGLAKLPLSLAMPLGSGARAFN